MIGVSVLSILAATALLSVQAMAFDITYTCSSEGITINLGNLKGNVTYRAAVGMATTSAPVPSATSVTVPTTTSATVPTTTSATVPTTTSATTTLSTADTNCRLSLRQVPPNNALKLTNCSWPGTWVLYLMEPQGALENVVGVGKIYTFPIDCKAQSQTVFGNLTVDSTATPIPLEPTITLNMSITPNPMYLGQEVSVTITEIGSVNHLLNLTSCTAASSDHNQTITLVSGGENQQKDLVKDITTGIGVVEMTLYGFRFMTDSNVELTCTVKVCESSATNCQSASATGRKRETIPVHSSSSSLHIVSGSFRVISDQEPQ